MSFRLKRAVARAFAVTAVALSAASAANAVDVNAQLTRVGGNTWDASFTVGADAGQTVEAFSIYFDWTKVSNILVWASPADWDSLAIQADAALTSDGYFDTLALAGGIGGGASLGGFIARFDWADAAGPATLRFTINDPTSFSPLETGFAWVTSPVPEPAAWALLLAGMGGVLLLRRNGRQSNG